MARTDHHQMPRLQPAPQAVPFDSAEEAWFWFIQANRARTDGARFALGQGMVPRPCEPLDIMKVLDRLYRNRRLVMDHLLVLRHYGVRMLPPDPRRAKEERACSIWREALARIEEVLITKGIVSARPPRNEKWFLEACVYEH